MTTERPVKTRGDASGYLASFFRGYRRLLAFSLLFLLFLLSYLRGVGVIYPLCTHRSCIVVFDTRTRRTYHTRDVSPTPELRSSDR